MIYSYIKEEHMDTGTKRTPMLATVAIYIGLFLAVGWTFSHCEGDILGRAFASLVIFSVLSIALFVRGREIVGGYTTACLATSAGLLALAVGFMA